MTYEFNSRETYLEARAAWKAEQHSLVKAIRAAKARRAETARAFSKEFPGYFEYWTKNSAERGRYDALYRPMVDVLSDLTVLRQQVAEHDAERCEMLVEADRQWREAHAG